jgi:hypothetical protein
MAIFTAEDLDRLARPHVGRAYFLEADLPSGMAYLHNGVGRFTMSGHTWQGVTSPLGTQLVYLSAIEEPRFGVATSVQIIISGANQAFFKSMHDTARELEGRSAKLYWAMFDGETKEILIGPKLLFEGFMSSPTTGWEAIGVRTVGITIESKWEAQNFPFGGRWNDADQQRRYPGDKGLIYVGQDVTEQWK